MIVYCTLLYLFLICVRMTAGPKLASLAQKSEYNLAVAFPRIETIDIVSLSQHYVFYGAECFSFSLLRFFWKFFYKWGNISSKHRILNRPLVFNLLWCLFFITLFLKQFSKACQISRNQHLVFSFNWVSHLILVVFLWQSRNRHRKN